MEFKKIYWIKNFETNENFSFPEDKVSLEQLKEYNEKRFNIYQSVNTFIGNRRLEKDLAEIKSCFIDIDYPDIISSNLDSKQRALYLKNKYENEVIPKLKEIKDLYELEPNEINLTYKGFHILFHYESSCFFIDSELHKEINNKLIDILGGDTNARDVARVYKVPGFIDWKYGKQGKIKNIVENKESHLEKNKIISLFKLNWKERNKNKVETSIEKKEQNIEKINSNIEKINNIDALIFIENLKNNIFELQNSKSIFSSELFNEIIGKLKIEKVENIYILKELDGIKNTSGLRIEEDEKNVWKINDYSKKNRRGNYNFFKNWIFENYQDQDLLRKILSLATNGINLNSNLSKKVPLDMKLFGDKVNKKANFNPYNLSKEDRLVFKNYTKDMFEKLEPEASITFFSIFSTIYSKKIEPIFDESLQKKVYHIYWQDLRETMGKDINNLNHHKVNLKKYLLMCSSIQIPRIVMTSEGEGTQFVGIFSVIFLNDEKVKGRGNKSKFILVPSFNEDFIYSKKIAYFNQNYLSAPLKAEAKNLLLKIDFVFNDQNTNIFFINYEELFKTLNLNSKNKATNIKGARKHLTYMLNQGFIKDFKFNKKTEVLSVFRYKQKIKPVATHLKKPLVEHP